MPRSPVQKLGVIFLAATGTVALGSAIYLLAGGARPGAPFVFVIGAALSLCATLYLLARAALSVVIEPQADEVRVATGRRRKELERDKQLLLKALKELAFDHEMHKISDDDYQDIAGAYRARAVRTMRQLDEGAEVYQRQIAEELAARRGEPGSEHPANQAAPPDAVKGEDARHACAACGTPNERDALFCKKCGAPIAVGAPT